MGEFSYLNAIPSALIAVDRSLMVQFINPAAENLFGVSQHQAANRPLSALPGCDADMCALCERVLASGEEISLFEQTLRLPLNHRIVTMHVTPVMGEGDAPPVSLLITIEKADGLDHLSGNMLKQEATRAAGVMAAMMAHEVKNPLSGIRGAAQILKDEVAPEHQTLTELICMETDRIRDLLAQVEIFANGVVENRQKVNIHEVLQYVISIAQTGFARHVTFKELYDPSLPDVLAHRDLLVQLFLNLVKNSAEALAGRDDATIVLSTSYRSGYRLRRNSSPSRGEAGRGAQLDNISQTSPHPNPPPNGEGIITLPVMVTVADNGPGIPEAIRGHLFEPFVSSKEEGRGLGLAVVAKIASDLGAVVELDEEYEGGTRFVVYLAIG